MKKGFTLIEMLGIIAVLAVVLLVTFPVMNKSLKKMKENTTNNFENNLKISAETYIELNRDNYPELDEGGSTTITIQDLYDANLLKGQYEGIDTTNKIIITKNIDNTLDYIYVNPNNIIEYTFNYTGGEQTFTIPQDGLYQIETWGAQGGDSTNNHNGGYGGYSTGIIKFNDIKKIYINIGGKGGTCSNDNCTAYGGYNGGGNSMNRDKTVGAGGGATHIALKSGLLSALSSNEDIPKILIISGAGGGSYYYSGNYNGKGGNAGGYKGSPGYMKCSGCGDIESEHYASGGTNVGIGEIGKNLGQFGKGADSTSVQDIGGGAGLYGGNSDSFNGGGGSSYIGNILLTGKSMYCYGCEESDEPSTFTVSTTGTSSLKDTINCPDGYNEKPVSKCAKAGNGYAKITYLGNSI